MSSWNWGLWRCFCQFESSRDSCATRFFRSCTTKADMRLKDSNCRAMSSDCVASTCASVLAACRPAVLRRSWTSQFRLTRPSERSRTTKPSSRSCRIRGTTSQARGIARSQPGISSPAFPPGSCRLTTHWRFSRKAQSGPSAASVRLEAGMFQAAACSKTPAPCCIHRAPAGLCTRFAIAWTERSRSRPGSPSDSTRVKRSHSSR